MKNKKYYKKLDLIRLLSCIAVFLYHLNILKGGYLAVCIFFVLTGYLSFISSFNKEKFSIKKYYVERLKNIYLPFILVVFITIFIVKISPFINWLNLKPETTSVIFGYNNFWQLKASLDYFARHVDSPFMHFWYTSILLQFELVFPIFFVGIKKINEKINKNIILVSLIVLSFIGSAYFIYSSFTQNIMSVYYGTFSRLFSILLGVTLGYVNCCYKKIIPNKLISFKFRNIIFYLYLLVLIILLLIIDSNSKYFVFSMILVTLISCRLIDYSTIEVENLTTFDKIVKSLSSVSYEIYLIQYPIIFLFQEFEFNFKYSIILIIMITVILSYVLHFALSIKKSKNKLYALITKIIILCIFILTAIFGFCEYLIEKGHTNELKELENQLSINQELMEEKQKEYAIKLEEEESKWKLTLESLSNEEENLKDYITNLHIIGIGDSVMLGAIKNLYQKFPKGYFDAKTSRTDWEANGILQRLKNRGMLGEPIIFGLGTNGQCGEKCRTKILNTAGNKKMFWITTTNKKASYINNQLKELSKNDRNTYIIDWEKESSGHNEYFIADKIHLTGVGKEAYTKYIYDEIYKVYLNEIISKKQNMIDEYEEKNASKINFYGNDLLLNSFEDLKETFDNSKFEVNNYDYGSLYSKILYDLNTSDLINNFVFVFDSNFKITYDEYKKIIDLLDEKKIYVILINSRFNLKYKDVKVIDLDTELKSDVDYLLVDRVHLSDKGKVMLVKRLEEEIK